MTHITIYSVDDVFGGKMRNLRIYLNEHVREVLYERLPLSFRQPVYRFFRSEIVRLCRDQCSENTYRGA